jgi:hypothetical protein
MLRQSVLSSLAAHPRRKSPRREDDTLHSISSARLSRSTAARACSVPEENFPGHYPVFINSDAVVFAFARTVDYTDVGRAVRVGRNCGSDNRTALHAAANRPVILPRKFTAVLSL